MIFTSYFANWRKFSKDFKLVSIALYPPRQGAYIQANELAPSDDLLRRYKNNKVSAGNYIIEYKDQLMKLDPVEIGNKYNNCILLCYEKPSDFCHRHLLRGWLDSHKIECKEL